MSLKCVVQDCAGLDLWRAGGAGMSGACMRHARYLTDPERALLARPLSDADRRRIGEALDQRQRTAAAESRARWRERSREWKRRNRTRPMEYEYEEGDDTPRRWVWRIPPGAITAFVVTRLHEIKEEREDLQAARLLARVRQIGLPDSAALPCACPQPCVCHE